MQSLGFSQLVSKAAHIKGASLDNIYLRNTENRFLCFKVKVESVYYCDDDTVFLYFKFKFLYQSFYKKNYKKIPVHLTDHQYVLFTN